MSEDAPDPPEDPDASQADLLRSGFHAARASSDGTVTYRLRGELDMLTSPALRRALDATLAGKPSSITLDLTELTFVDSCGLGVFVAASRHAASIGCSFVLRSPGRAALRTLRVSGLESTIDIEFGDAVV